MEICIETLGRRLESLESTPCVSSSKRPFKLFVKNSVFTVDSEKFRRLSPVFAAMCFGKDFENGRELVREIVDEKTEDIQTFLNCVDDHSQINEWNFPTLIRLASKYQVDVLTDACEEYILTSDLGSVKPDQVLTLLLAAHDHHLKKSVVSKIILRLAGENKETFARLKIGRFLPSQLYGAVIATSLNLVQIREIETMNGHLLRMERSKTQYRRALCDGCKRIVDAAQCEGCRQALCQQHWSSAACTSDYGMRMLKEMKDNLVEFDYPSD